MGSAALGVITHTTIVIMFEVRDTPWRCDQSFFDSSYRRRSTYVRTSNEDAATRTRSVVSRHTTSLQQDSPPLKKRPVCVCVWTGIACCISWGANRRTGIHRKDLRRLTCRSRRKWLDQNAPGWSSAFLRLSFASMLSCWWLFFSIHYFSNVCISKYSLSCRSWRPHTLRHPGPCSHTHTNMVVTSFLWLFSFSFVKLQRQSAEL